MFDLDGRVALVTGAGQGAGEGIAACLAGRGARVALNDLVPERAEDAAKRIAAAGGEVVPVAFDVTRAADVAEGFARVESRWGGVDILVNNAGVPADMQLSRFREMDASEWQRYVDLNLYGVLHCVKACVDGMCERGWGRIITISSGVALTGLSLGVSLYAAGKGGALSFMRNLAMEVARNGVTANSLALGVLASAGGAEETRALAASVPVGRLGTPQDIGAAVVFLASQEAGWITGQTLGVDGGQLTR